MRAAVSKRLKWLITVRTEMVKIMPEKQFFGKILVPVDDSNSCLAAEELTVLLAKKFGSKVTAFHVVTHELMNPAMQDFLPGGDTDMPAAYIARGTADSAQVIPTQIPSQPSTSMPRSKVIRELNSAYFEQGEAILDEAVAVFKDGDVRVERELVQRADTAGAIIKEAEEGSYDLIVMGRSAGEEERKPHLGSVAAKTVRHAKIPVLVVAEKPQFSKILVAVDGSKASQRAAEQAAIIAKKTDAKVTLLHVQESSLFRMKPELSSQIGNRILSSVANLFKGTNVEQRLESGDAAKVIADLASEESYDVVVMGNKGHSSVRRFMLGSVVDHVVHYANEAVLIVK
jgi:nucleotide-binding universal stress UspA family protein